MPSRCNNTNIPCRRARPSRYKCLHRSIACFSVLLALGVTGFIVGMTSYFAPPIEHPVSTQPLDTRIISVDQELCGDLGVKNNTDLLEVILYILYNMPTTQPGASFSEHSYFQEITNIDPDDFSYSYYLLEGSTVDLTVYLDHYSSGDNVWMLVYLFDQDVVDKCTDYPIHSCTFLSREAPCIIPNITIPTDGQYYISVCYRSKERIFVSGNSTALVHKLVYTAEQQNIREQCTAPCYEGIYHIGDYVMIATSNVTRNVTWEDSVVYSWLCSDIRSIGIWVSFIMLLGMFLVMLSVGFIVALCVVMCIRMRTESEETELLIPSSDLSPGIIGSIPPPQYTVASENSLRSPPPYTEVADPQTVQLDSDK